MEKMENENIILADFDLSLDQPSDRIEAKRIVDEFLAKNRPGLPLSKFSIVRL